MTSSFEGIQSASTARASIGTGVSRWLSTVSETLTGAASKIASKPSVLCSIVTQ